MSGANVCNTMTHLNMLCKQVSLESQFNLSESGKRQHQLQQDLLHEICEPFPYIHLLVRCHILHPHQPEYKAFGPLK